MGWGGGGGGSPPANDAEADALFAYEVVRVAGAASMLEVECAQPATRHRHLHLQRALRRHLGHEVILEDSAAHEAVAHLARGGLHAVAAAREDLPPLRQEGGVLEVDREGELGRPHASRVGLGARVEPHSDVPRRGLVRVTRAAAQA